MPRVSKIPPANEVIAGLRALSAILCVEFQSLIEGSSRTQGEHGPNLDPIGSRLEKAAGKGCERGGQLLVGFRRALPLRVGAEQYRGVIADPLRHRMNGNAGIEERGRMDASQIVEACFSETDGSIRDLDRLSLRIFGAILRTRSR